MMVLLDSVANQRNYSNSRIPKTAASIHLASHPPPDRAVLFRKYVLIVSRAILVLGASIERMHGNANSAVSATTDGDGLLVALVDSHSSDHLSDRWFRVVHSGALWQVQVLGSFPRTLVVLSDEKPMLLLSYVQDADGTIWSPNLWKAEWDHWWTCVDWTSCRNVDTRAFAIDVRERLGVLGDTRMASWRPEHGGCSVERPGKGESSRTNCGVDVERIWPVCERDRLSTKTRTTPRQSTVDKSAEFARRARRDIRFPRREICDWHVRIFLLDRMWSTDRCGIGRWIASRSRRCFPSATIDVDRLAGRSDSTRSIETDRYPIVGNCRSIPSLERDPNRGCCQSRRQPDDPSCHAMSIQRSSGWATTTRKFTGR